MAQRTLTEATYPGAPILLLQFSRGDEAGDVRVQKYSDAHLRVATFLPGIVVQSPGDTAKVEPEVSQWVGSEDEAKPVFDRYCETARAAGWKEEETKCPG